MSKERLIDWLLEGDVSVQYQTHRDLLGAERPDLQTRIANEGWGAAFLAKRRADGHWGQAFYQPKWISTHYTLLDLRHLAVGPSHPQIRESVLMVAETEKSPDGGVNPHTELLHSDVCVNGMFLNYACYFKVPEEKLRSVVDFILSQRMPDGGFNCHSNRSGAVHSSMHTTISTLEGILEYLKNGYAYRLDELLQAKASSEEFLLKHQFFLSDRTGEIIKKDFLKLSYPSRWKYDILRALDYFQAAGSPWDERFQPAIDVLLSKKNKDGTWNVQAHHPGQVHFVMEKAGTPSRWNTLRALRVLNAYEASGIR